MSTKIVSARIDEELASELNRVARERGVSRSELIRQYLSSGINPVVVEAPRAVRENNSYSEARFNAYDKLFGKGRVTAIFLLTQFKSIECLCEAVLEYSELFRLGNAQRRKALKREGIALIANRDEFFQFLSEGLKDRPFYSVLGLNHSMEKHDAYLLKLSKQLRTFNHPKIEQLITELTHLMEKKKADSARRKEEFDQQWRQAYEQRSQQQQQQQQSGNGFYTSDGRYRFENGRFYDTQETSNYAFYDSINSKTIEVTSNEIFKSLARRYHPDVCRELERDAATEKMSELNHVWDLYKSHHSMS